MKQPNGHNIRSSNFVVKFLPQHFRMDREQQITAVNPMLPRT